jgi:uncharacterized protein YwgA
VSKKVSVESGTDILFALLYSPGLSGKFGEPIKGYTRLEKLLFLLDRESGLGRIIEKDYNFEPFDYGPCAQEIYDDVEMLKDAHLLSAGQVATETALDNVDDIEQGAGEGMAGAQEKTDVFQLTEKGEKIGKMIFESLSPEDRQKIMGIKAKFNSQPTSAILRYVYTKYPDMIVRSKVKEKILSAS